LEPGSTEVLRTQAYVLRGEGRFDEALAAYRHLLQIKADDASIFNQIAVCSLQLGHLEDAVEALRRALQLDPSDRSLVNQKLMGETLVLLRRDEAAIDYLQRGLEIGRLESNSEIHGFLAVAYAHTGRLTDARHELTLSPPYLTVRFLKHRKWSTPDLVRQWSWVADGYALAGLRDHVNEDAEPEISAAIGIKAMDLLSPTPTTVSRHHVATATTLDGPCDLGHVRYMF
jgi:tetratricopeptide (TPR) repeat protein